MAEHPQARSEDLVVEEIGQETLVYDLAKDRAHCLNRTSSWIWKRCDGRTSVAELTVALCRELGTEFDEQWVRISLKQLSRAGLLDRPARTSSAFATASRREFAKKLGKMAVLVPVISSVTAPLSAQLLSCVDSCVGKPNCTPCKSGDSGKCDKFCCNGNCVGLTAASTHCNC